MPPRKKVTKDFLKEVFAGRKHLIPRAQLRPVEVPKYDELSVVSLIADIMKEKELAKFFPEQRTKADLPDRQFFFNVVNTTDPDYLAALLKHAHNLRFGAKNPQDNPTTIEVNEQWAKELQASPFYSRKDFRVILCRSSWEDADAVEEELQEGQVRLQAEEAHRRGLLPGDQGEGRGDDGLQPQAVCSGSGRRRSEATVTAAQTECLHVI